MILGHIGRTGVINANLTCDKFEMIEEDVPQSYYLWKSDVASDRDTAISSLGMTVAGGDADTNATLVGYSSDLTDKSAGPVYVDHVKINGTVDLEEFDVLKGIMGEDPDFHRLLKIVKQCGVAQKLYMSYKITPP